MLCFYTQPGKIMHQASLVQDRRIATFLPPTRPTTILQTRANLQFEHFWDSSPNPLYLSLLKPTLKPITMADFFHRLTKYFRVLQFFTFPAAHPCGSFTCSTVLRVEGRCMLLSLPFTNRDSDVCVCGGRGGGVKGRGSEGERGIIIQQKMGIRSCRVNGTMQLLNITTLEQVIHLYEFMPALNELFK